MNILEEIQENYISFSEKEKLIATYLLQNSDSIANINISELAKLTNTSPATITRFAKKVNCRSFVDLKIKLNVSSTISTMEHHEFVDSVYNSYTKVIDNTRKMIHGTDLRKVSQLIAQSTHILIFGVASSGLTALEFTQRLLRMGLNVSAVTDPYAMLISSSVIQKTDLVIALSTSGETVEVVDSMKMAKKVGATVIGITTFSNSPLAKLCDVTLISYNSLFVDNKRFVNSQFASMYIIDILSTLLLEETKLRHNMDVTIDFLIKNKNVKN